MDEFVKDQFRIDNDGATESTLYCYVNVNQQILVRVTEHCWDTGTEFFGESIEEHNDAGIQLTKENAIKLRDELDRLIKSHYCPTHNEVGLNREQSDSQGFCSRCDCSSLRIINNKTQF